MSDPIFPLAVWQEGTLQNDVPANDNSLRLEATSRLVISDSTTAQPGSPSDGDVYIIPASATGSQWGTFTEGDVAIYRGGTWIAFEPVQGVVVNVAASLKAWDGSSWQLVAGGGASGDVTGPALSTDNAIPRFDGTTGKVIQDSQVVIGDSGEIHGYRGDINLQTGTTYTLQQSDSGKVVELDNSAAITLTLPNSLPHGFCCTVVQGGSGQVTFSPASGATLNNRQSHAKLAGMWAPGTIYVRSNSGGASAEYVLAGDTAA